MTTRRPVVAGNWKMNLDHVQAVHVLTELGMRLRGSDVANVDVVVLPPFTDLRSASSVVEAERLELALGAQHVSEHEAGAYTGEVAATMLARLGVTTVLCGHSERRLLFGMEDDAVGRTAATAARAGVAPMVCVGERAEERESGETAAVLERQLRAALTGLGEVDPERCSVAYEPVWAIGTGDAATPEDAQEACSQLRAIARDTFGDGTERLRILYGGSSTAENAAALVQGPDVDGLLVGGASLTAASFADVVVAVADCYRSSGRPRR